MSSFFKKYALAFLALALLGLIVLKHAQTLEKPSHETLVIGLQSGYPPFEFMDNKGKLVGFDVDLAAEIAAKLNKELVIKDMEFEGEILSLKQGKIDLIISGMNITPSRLKEIAMVPYHGEAATALSLIFWEEIPPNIQSLADIALFPHLSVSVEAGSVPETFISKYPEIQTKAFQGALAPLIDVKYGKSVANLVEPDVATYLKKQHPEIQILHEPLLEEEAIQGFGIGIKKDNLELLQQIQQIIQELKASGKLKQLEDKWFKGVE